MDRYCVQCLVGYTYTLDNCSAFDWCELVHQTQNDLTSLLLIFHFSLTFLVLMVQSPHIYGCRIAPEHSAWLLFSQRISLCLFVSVMIQSCEQILSRGRPLNGIRCVSAENYKMNCEAVSIEQPTIIIIIIHSRTLNANASAFFTVYPEHNSRQNVNIRHAEHC